MGTLFKLHCPHTMLKHQNLNVLQLLLFLHKIQTSAYVFITTNLKKSNTKGKKLRIYNNINEQVWGFKPSKSSTVTNSLLKSNYFITLVCTASLTWFNEEISGLLYVSCTRSIWASTTWCIDPSLPQTLHLHLHGTILHVTSTSRMHDKVAPKQAPVACIRENTSKQLCNTARWTPHRICKETT